MKVKLTRLANHDLQSVRNDIHQDKPGAAQAVVQRVFKAIDQLVTFPMLVYVGRGCLTHESLL